MPNSNTITAGAITGGNLFINGIGMLGELVSAELPKFEHETLETAGQIGKYELVLPTLKPVSAKFTVNNVAKTYFQLLNTSKKQGVYIKSNISSMGEKETGVIVTCEGNIKVLESPNFEMGKEAQLSFEMSCLLVKYELDGNVALMYDAQNSSYSIDGIDIYEKIRKNIL